MQRNSERSESFVTSFQGLRTPQVGVGHRTQDLLAAPRILFEAIEVFVEAGAVFFGERWARVSADLGDAVVLTNFLVVDSAADQGDAESFVWPWPPPPGVEPPPPPPLGLIRLDCNRSSIASVSAAIAVSPVSG